MFIATIPFPNLLRSEERHNDRISVCTIAALPNGAGGGCICGL